MYQRVSTRESLIAKNHHRRDGRDLACGSFFIHSFIRSSFIHSFILHSSFIHPSLHPSLHRRVFALHAAASTGLSLAALTVTFLRFDPVPDPDTDHRPWTNGNLPWPIPTGTSPANMDTGTGPRRCCPCACHTCPDTRRFRGEPFQRWKSAIDQWERIIPIYLHSITRYMPTLCSAPRR